MTVFLQSVGCGCWDTGQGGFQGCPGPTLLVYPATPAGSTGAAGGGGILISGFWFGIWTPFLKIFCAAPASLFSLYSFALPPLFWWARVGSFIVPTRLTSRT